MSGSTIDTYRSKSELVTEQLRELILAGELAPGDPLRQRQLADRFDVSPTPVREALHRLEAEGFVKTRPHRSTSVVRLPEARIRENQVIRMALEALATEMAADHMTADGLEELRELNERLTDPDLSEANRFQLNRQFHFSVYEAAGSPVLMSLLQQLWRTMEVGSRLSRHASEAASDHERIIAALEQGDGALAASLVREHIAAGTPVAPGTT